MTTIRGSQVATGSKDTLELELQLPSNGYLIAYCLRPCAKNRISLPPLKSQLVKCTSRCRTSGCRFPRLAIATTVNRTAPLPRGYHQGLRSKEQRRDSNNAYVRDASMVQ